MIRIPLPKVFNKKLLFQYLKRSPNEITFHVLSDSIVLKLFPLADRLILCQLDFIGDEFILTFPDTKPSPEEGKAIKEYCISWFDLETDLDAFYHVLEKDPIVKPVIHNHRGLRMVKAPDLFEAISWSIIGQQINLPFAYTCKKALVEKVGKKLLFEGITYYAFPEPDAVLTISDETFRAMKFSSQKVKYIRIAANEIKSGKLRKSELEELSFIDAKARLIELKGIGNWSANYVLMRCLGFKEAFPLEDVGLHNALKFLLKRDSKPSLLEIKELAKKWSGWEAYVTFYLWQSLLKD